MMRIISKKALSEFSNQHQDVKVMLNAWHNDVKHASWQNWADLKKQYPTVSSVGSDRYVFNIKGNHYRIITLINFIKKIVFIRFIGTHKEYDKITNVKEV